MLAPAEAAEQFGHSAAFLVTIWSPGGGCSKVQRQLRSLGCRRVVSFFPLLWKCPHAFGSVYCLDLPHKVLEQRELVQAAFALWADEGSRREYVAQLRLRLRAEVEALPPPVEHEQYFPDDLYELGAEETFVNCGAVDGDTIRRFFARTGPAFSGVLALEPDAANYRKLADYIAALPPEVAGKVQIRPWAAAAANGRARFTSAGTSSAITADGAAEVECVTLDGAMPRLSPTYIKMDIEGAEINALSGARRLIQDHLPFLAITVYHKQNDLWRIPLLIRSFSPQYRLFLRPHDEAFELACYAVPPRRSRRPSPFPA